MIRVIILAVGVFLLWVLLASGFTKKRKTIIVTIAMLFSVAALWLESNWLEPKANLVELEQITSCGVTAKHSYRTNFDISLCFKNSSEAYVRRLGFNVIATQCIGVECIEIERVERDLQLDLDPNSTKTVVQSLAFNLVNPANKNIEWAVEPITVKATKK